METVIGLCLLLLGVCHGIETYCDGRQSGAQCYGALGGNVVVQLMNSASDIYRYEWKKNKEVKLSGKGNRIESDLTGTRFSFTPSDGTFRINNLNRDDSGEYILDTYDSAGTKLEPRTLQLLIQGIDTYCDGRQSGAQCYGALGGSVVVRLMNSASDIYRYEWKKNKEVKLSGKGNRIESDLTGTRFSFTPSDGTFRINNLNRDDSGEYILETYDSTGRQLEPRTLQLLIEGIETYCDGRQNRAQCYGALGGSVVVRLMDSASDIYRYEWKKNKEVILSGKRNRIESDLTGTRFSFTPSDGTFRINNLNRDDSGEYILDAYDSTGRQLEPRTLQLLI